MWGKVCAVRTDNPDAARYSSALHQRAAVVSVRRGAWWPCELSWPAQFLFFFRVDKGSLADKSGATGQRKGAERQRGVGAFFFFFFW